MLISIDCCLMVSFMSFCGLIPGVSVFREVDGNEYALQRNFFSFDYVISFCTFFYK